MIRAVSDTHGVIWYAWADPRMSPTARAVFDSAAATGDQVGISSISLVEIVYLIEKRRINPATLQRVAELMATDKLLAEVLVDRKIADVLATIPRPQVPDMPDRIIAATALHLGVPLISRDGKIRASSVRTIW